MARKIISKGTGANSTSKRQPNTKGCSSTGNMGDSNRANEFATSCRHNYNQRNADNTRRPFKSETNLFASNANTCLQPIGDRNVTPVLNCHNSIVNASNGFIPISKHAGQENKLAYEDDPSQSQKSDGGSEVTMFKTKVLYHSRSDFRPIGLTEDQTSLEETREKEANV